MKSHWKYGVRAYGIKKRCRQPDWHSSDKDEIGKSDVLKSREEVEKLAREWIAKNMRVCVKARAKMTRWYDTGENMEEWRPFNEEDNLSFELNMGDAVTHA